MRRRTHRFRVDPNRIIILILFRWFCRATGRLELKIQNLDEYFRDFSNFLLVQNDSHKCRELFEETAEVQFDDNKTH